MKDKTMMRANAELLKELETLKLVKQESYASVIKRLIERDRRIRK